jgi:hypothetical protein
VSEFAKARETIVRSSERLVTTALMVGTKVATDAGVPEHTERVSRELRQARAVGQLTVLTAQAKLRKLLERPASEKEPVATPATVPQSDAVAPECVPNYANLSASQIVPLLKALDESERREVLEYELATRRRKTILAALGADLA